MPLSMDIHEQAPEGLTLAALEVAHQLDLEHQTSHGVTYLRYWADVTARKIFCLVEAPSADAATAVHREGTGLVANRVYEVVEGH
jgi:cytosine/adenosine deaminase-related metal-dependent hydrolase